DRQVLLSLKGANDLLAELLEMGSKEWVEAKALAEEAAKRYETAEARLGVLRNHVVDVAIQVGDQFLPALKGATDALGTMVSGFGQLDGVARDAVTGIGVLAGGIAGVIGLVGTVGPKFRQFQESLASMGSGGQF